MKGFAWCDEYAYGEGRDELSLVNVSVCSADTAASNCDIANSSAAGSTQTKGKTYTFEKDLVVLWLRDGDLLEFEVPGLSRRTVSSYHCEQGQRGYIRHCTIKRSSLLEPL